MEHCLLFLYNTKSAKILLDQTNIVYKSLCPYQEYLLKSKNNSYIGYTNTTLSCSLAYHFSENSTIKQHLIIKHNNSTNHLTSSDVKILTDKTIIIYKNNTKK